MTSIIGGGLPQQPQMRLFDYVDVDKDQTVSLEELRATKSGESDETINAAFGNLDRNADGKVARAEMSFSAFAFSDDALKVLIAAQIRSAAARGPTEQAPIVENNTRAEAAGEDATEKPAPRLRPSPPTTWAPSYQSRFPNLPERPAYVKTNEEQRLTADYFARADIDEDGMISQDEWKVEHSLVRQAMTDTGLAPEIVFMPQDHDSNGLISPDELGVGHVVHIKPSNVIFFGDRPVAEQDAFIAERERERDRQRAFNTQFPAYARPLSPSLQRESAETARDKRQALEAEYTREMSGPKGYYRMSERHLAVLREMKPVIDTPALSDLLAARLMRQTLAGLETQPANPAKPKTA